VRGPLGLALALWLAVGPVAWAGPRCQVERSADARLRLAVWGGELAGAKGSITARATRQAAMVQTRGGAVLDALFLVTLQDAGDPARPGANLSRPQWVRCARPEVDVGGLPWVPVLTWQDRSLWEG
jgi:hypothetical protein